MKSTDSTIVYTYKAKRTLDDLINGFINLYVACRIGRQSREFNLMRRGSLAVFANGYIGIKINQHGFFEGFDLDMVFVFLNPILAYIGIGTVFDIGTTPEALLRLIRQRWTIENEWHWARDAQLCEDAHRYANRTGAAVFSLLHTIAMNLLRLGGCRSIRHGLRQLAYDMQGMLALGGVTTARATA